jgi:hypothetical protein
MICTEILCKGKHEFRLLRLIKRNSTRKYEGKRTPTFCRTPWEQAENMGTQVHILFKPCLSVFLLISRGIIDGEQRHQFICCKINWIGLRHTLILVTRITFSTVLAENRSSSQSSVLLTMSSGFLEQ